MKHITIAIFVITHFCMVTLVNASVIMQTGFEHQEAGTPMTRDLWQSEDFQPASWDQGLQSRTQIDDSIAIQGLHSLRVMYPKDEYGTANTGCQVSLLFPSRNEVYASYFLRFSENFSWGTTNYGGKLPGLAGGENCSGGRSCDGTNGWSARFMWRSGGKLILYLYDMLKPDTYGLDVQLTHTDGTPIIAERGKWYHITERVKMNSSPEEADGEVQVWVNGEEALLLTNRKFTTNDVKIDNFYISTFHGGDDEGWCPTDTCYTYFDQIMVGTTYEDVCYSTCPKPNLGPDQALCANGTAKFEVNMPQGYSLSWTKDGQKMGEGASFSTSTAGRYIVVAESGHCYQNDTVIVSDELQIKLPTSTHICATSFVTLNTQLEANDNLIFSWQRDGVLIGQANNPTLMIKDAGRYKVTVSSSNCKTASDSTIVTSGLLSIEDINGIEGERAEITLSEDGSFLWLDESGNLIGSGERFSVVLPSGEEFIYVKDEYGFDGNIGKRQLTENAWTRNNFDKEFMQFVVERELSIDSISIYPTKALDATINIVDEGQNQVVFSQTYKGLKGGDEARLPLGVTLPAGNYHISAEGTTASLYHSHTDSDIQFPYTVDGLISLTGCNLAWINNKGWYMFFYNWHVSAGNHCAATPVKLTGRGTNGTSETKSDNPFAYQSGHYLIINDNSIGKRITITDLSGKVVAIRISTGEPMVINTTYWEKGIYMVNDQKVLLENR